MKFYLKLGLILLAFCVVATGILAYVNSLTKPKIDKLKAEQAMQSRSELIPNADFEEVLSGGAEPFTYYIARDMATKQVKGYTFTAAKIGYSSKVQTMAAVDTTFKLINIKVIDQAETPGLGANCTQDAFTSQFANKTLDQLVVDKDGAKPPNAIVSLTGATITTRAITNSLKEQILLLKADVQVKALDSNIEEVME